VHVADLTPEQKLDWIHTWQRNGKTVAMVGDGINDAPSLVAANVGIGMGARGSDAALAQADVGMAMNSGTSAAKEAANMVDHVIIYSEYLSQVQYLKQIGPALTV